MECLRSYEKLVIVGTNQSWEAVGKLNYFRDLLELYWSGTLEELWKVGESGHQSKLRGEEKLKYFKALLDVSWSGRGMLEELKVETSTWNIGWWLQMPIKVERRKESWSSLQFCWKCHGVEVECWRSWNLTWNIGWWLIADTNQRGEVEKKLKYFTALLVVSWSGMLEELWKVGINFKDWLVIADTNES